MIKLNLVANNIQLQKIKEYLENNVSELLAEKINNGVHITKDNKTLINKKDLNGFWKYATEEARKQANKGDSGAWIDDNTVYGWAIHYFEEDSIEGNLFNEDGTEYKVAIKTSIPKIEPKNEKPKNENKQATLFDLMNIEEKEETDNEELFSEEEKEEILEQVAEENKNIITTQENVSIDAETGEVLSVNSVETSSFDKETMIMLYTVLEGKLEAK